MNKDDKLNIVLTKAEALVLFEFLSRFSDTEKLTIEDRSEEIALWGLTNLFERELTEPFKDNYDILLAQARQELRNLQEE